MTKFESEEDIYYLLAEWEDDTLISLLAEWKKSKGLQGIYQSWKVIPSGTLIKEWNYNAKTHLTHDKVIEKIERIVIDNYLKIYVNTILFGHTELSPFHYVERVTDEFETEDQLEELLEDYEWFACDTSGNWRISDYGLDKMESLIIQLLATDDGNTKLYLIDQILSIAHQRSDLSSWFVDGGAHTLNKLAAA